MKVPFFKLGRTIMFKASMIQAPSKGIGFLQIQEVKQSSIFVVVYSIIDAILTSVKPTLQ